MKDLVPPTTLASALSRNVNAYRFVSFFDAISKKRPLGRDQQAAWHAPTRKFEPQIVEDQASFSKTRTKFVVGRVNKRTLSGDQASLETPWPNFRIILFSSSRDSFTMVIFDVLGLQTTNHSPAGSNAKSVIGVGSFSITRLLDNGIRGAFTLLSSVHNMMTDWQATATTSSFFGFHTIWVTFRWSGWRSNGTLESLLL